MVVGEVEHGGKGIPVVPAVGLRAGSGRPWV